MSFKSDAEIKVACPAHRPVTGSISFTEREQAQICAEGCEEEHINHIFQI